MTQCRSPVHLEDPERMHPGYAGYLARRERKARRKGYDPLLCQRSAFTTISGEPLCQQHAAYRLLDAVRVYP